MGGDLRFVTLTRDVVEALLPQLSALSATEEWLAWRPEQFLIDLPRKWELSRAVYEGDKLVAYCLASVRGRFMWVHRFIVGSEVRSKGIGARLIDEMQRLSAELGLKGILLKTPNNNDRGLAFYRRLNFSDISVSDGHVLLRRLNPGEEFAVAIHQPNFVPWLGYFYKISQCDAFIFLDDVIFPKGSFVNRNRICINNAAAWLTVPLTRGLDTRIIDARSSGDWVPKHLRTLEMNYKRAPFFSAYFPELGETLEGHKDSNIAELNSALVRLVASWLGINRLFYSSSEFEASGTGDERLVSLVRHLGGDVYISGSGGANYQAQETFDLAGINLKYSNFKVIPYRQISSEFIPNLSVLDALFNIGSGGITELFSRVESEK